MHDEILELARYEDDCPECGGQGYALTRHPELVPATGDGVVRCGCGTGKVPRIRTSDGRTLRKHCPNKRRVIAVVVEDRVSNEVTDNCEVLLENCICQGRSWVPVSKAEAVVVCLEWLRQVTKTHPRITEVMMGLLPNGAYLTEEDRGSILAEVLNDDDPIPAAVLAAAKRVAEEASDEVSAT